MVRGSRAQVVCLSPSIVEETMGKGQDVTTENKALVPVWTLATEAVSLPDVLGDGDMTPARLAELRTVLAALTDSPIATLEAHPISTKRERSGGIPLNAASPLAQQLSHLVAQTTKSAPSTLKVADSGEVLYRMVVPAKVAAQVGKGLVRPMPAAAGGFHGALVNSTGIVGQAAFVPVAGKAAAAGAATGSAATVGVAAVGAGVVTVAAPLVLMAVAVGVSAHADRQRQESIARITDLLEQLHEDNLDSERNELDACRDAIGKATSILLDQGRAGLSLGLDSASYAISKAIERSWDRLRKWQDALVALPDGPVELGALTKAFPGIDEEGGEFRAHLAIARLAIALKRRVIVLQAVEHAQLEGTDNPFKSFIATLNADDRRVSELEAGINSVLLRLSTLELKRGRGFRSLMFTQGEVDDLLHAVYRLRALGDSVNVADSQADLAIEMERSSDGSLVVFPATVA